MVVVDDIYNYSLSQCGINFGDHYLLQWQVIGKRIHFKLKLSGIPENDDFWIGIGFSKIQVNSPVDESEVLAILRLQGAISLEIFSIKIKLSRLDFCCKLSLPMNANEANANEKQIELAKLANESVHLSGKIESAESMSDKDEQASLTYTYKNSTSLDSNFTRSLYTDHFFNNIRNRRQTFTTTNIQLNRTSSSKIPILYNPVINPNSPNYTAVLRQNEEALMRYRDPTCIFPDPYWCKNYVKQYVNWQQTYNNHSIQAICAPLKASVANAHNRCCQAVRSTGC
uniref:DOMON domain-containing protein n=1 Tax=Loa loa TaxID=7209 RepID=A0A1I7VRB6_LOALO